MNKAAPPSPRPPPAAIWNRGKDGANKYLRNIPDNERVVREAIAQGEGWREHPVPDKHFGEDAIHERGGGARPATASRKYKRNKARGTGNPDLERNSRMVKKLRGFHGAELLDHTALQVIGPTQEAIGM